eukprot:TRINITY_DN16312_c5_g1_i1.p4 TRINITY_DN16312_c5_g1~~TRINITY_DN16312_c5_g1_i1.p4  ORF type:complete len:113 (+),score=15.38 TRINITY_DN16312_c5_g1_i1:373-711(+)
MSVPCDLLWHFGLLLLSQRSAAPFACRQRFLHVSGVGTVNVVARRALPSLSACGCRFITSSVSGHELATWSLPKGQGCAGTGCVELTARVDVPTIVGQPTAIICTPSIAIVC